MVKPSDTEHVSFTLQYSKSRQALNASNAEISKDFLHENIRCILLAETSGLTSSEFASVLATSGTTGADGESIGNSWTFSHLLEAFSTQWRDAALAARDTKARTSEAVVAVVDTFDLSGHSETASRIHDAISGNETDPQIVGYEDDDDGNTTKKTLELLEQFDGNLEDGDPSVFQVAVFKKHVSFWLVSSVPEVTFLLLALVRLTAWLSHPLIESLQSLVAKARRV